MVAPFVGAWIEMMQIDDIRTAFQVAPFVGAWIEIRETKREVVIMESLRSSERGLK